ncbi:MAG TPA: bifunctional phosphopantothenoylcysteine decarboxylase/phosphopantothenate--cysteine ligase CoaBC [Armatimonadota bacterium]
MRDSTHFVVVLGVTGSIAAYKAAEIIRQLRALRDPAYPERRVDVRVVLTANGARFITPTTLQTLSGNPVQQEMFASPLEWDIQHVSLADEADLLLIAPATANMLAKLANGLADDLLSSTALACTAPLLIAPAMNVHMWEHPANQENVRRLAARDAVFIGPDTGALACGYEGRGRLSPVEEIVGAVARYFTQSPRADGAACDFAGRTVLVTAGPTREYLDPVRFLSNPSSGKMGYALARAARARGAAVILVSGPVQLPAPAGVTVIPVTSNAEMAAAVLDAAGQADVIIGAAAPADFAPAEQAAQKVKKAGKSSLSLDLLPTRDILAEAGARKRPGQIIVAFAAESEQLEEHAREKLARKHADLVVANEITAPDSGFEVDTNRAVLLFADGRRRELPLQAKAEMAERILDAVAGLLLP